MHADAARRLADMLEQAGDTRRLLEHLQRRRRDRNRVELESARQFRIFQRILQIKSRLQREVVQAQVKLPLLLETFQQLRTIPTHSWN